MGSPVAACLAVYLLISRFITGNPGALTLLGVAPDLAAKFGALSAPLIAALLMTTLLPNVPALQRVDASLLAFFQRMGSIPEAVRDLSKRILAAKLTINEERFSGDIDNLLDLPEEVSKELRRDDAAGQPIRLPLTRVIAMFLCLKRWQDLPRYGEFFAESGEKFKDLSKKFAELAEEARVAFAIIQIAPGATAQDAPAVAEYQHVLASYFKAHVDGVRRELCDLMAAALLAGERSNRDINNRLVEAGFVLSDEKPSRLDVNRVVSIVIAVFGIFLVGGAAIGSYLHLDMQVPQVIAVSLLIAAV